MKFGQLHGQEPVDCTLPPATVPLFSTARQSFRFYWGAPAWGNREWVGELYPPGIRQGEMLRAYAEVFNAVELNTTFYGIPSAERVERWVKMVPRHFRFCPKFFQAISHEQRFADRVIQDFCHMMRLFGENLGMSFLQLPETFTCRDHPLLEKILQAVPEDFSIAVEFRHGSWFRDHVLVPEGTQLLTQYGASTVMTDTLGRRDVLHSQLTRPQVFVRFAGRNGHATDIDRLEAWADRLNQWRAQGVEEVYFFVHQPEEKHIPQTIRLLAQGLRKKWNPQKMGNPMNFEILDQERFGAKTTVEQLSLFG